MSWQYRLERYGELKVIIGIDDAGLCREVIYPDKPPWNPYTVLKELRRHWGSWKHQTRFLSATEFLEELEQKLSLLRELVREEG